MINRMILAPRPRQLRGVHK